IQKEELYEIRVHNRSKNEIAVSVKIDGIDSFEFSDDRNPTTGRPIFAHWIVAPGGTLKLPGWHKTNDPKRDDTFLSFLVTDYGKGASSKLAGRSQGEVGVITVAISNSHDPSSSKGTAKSGAETGFGPPVKGLLKPIERRIDP